jgi:Predicted pyridoxal phosphate-dependent enzyme apparently involved in regulation of cell wall biogenesis
MACFSFHPVKTLTSGEGGMVTTRDADLAQRLRQARAHGLTRDPGQFRRTDAAFDRGTANPWHYEQLSLGYNYRLPDILCALGHSQLSKLEQFSQRRGQLAARYDALMPHLDALVSTVPALPWCEPTLHLYVVRIDFAKAGLSRRQVMEGLKARGIGSQVHYAPVPDQPYYQDLYGTSDVPGAHAYYDRTLSLPLYPAMQDQDVDRVVHALAEVLGLQA